MKENPGIYIHIPFCLSKCPYCDFYSVKPDDSVLEAYTDAVCRALAHSGHEGTAVDSVYFGGGTPSVMNAGQIGRMLDAVCKQFAVRNAEITIEANPVASPEQKLAELKAAGVNRVSFGVQTGVDSELKALGRLHTARDAVASITAAQKAGFENISADLMLGIPYQNRKSLEHSIRFLTDLPLLHISAYMLKIERDTPFFKQNLLSLCPDEDEVAGMYLDCVGRLESAGFLQYEISNFAKPGKESRHNLKYWRCAEYLGVGPSAHAYMDGKRFRIPCDINAFISAENPAALAVPDGDGGGFEETAMLQLRLKEGLDLSRAAKRFGVDTSAIAKKAAALEKQGLLTFRDNIIALLPEGFLLSNSVTAELLF